MKIPSFSVMWAFLLGCLATQVKAYPSWPMYVQAMPREYPEDDYYYAPKVQYSYGEPSIRGVQQAPAEVYGRIPYPYYYDTLNHYADEDPIRQDERLAALPVGQETWFESEPEPSWHSSDMDDVNAAFLDNLILTQMAQDAQRRREYASQARSLPMNDYEEHDSEDEDVRELKALAGKPLYHVPKTVPRIEEEDYPNDEGFINWNGNKRSVSTTTVGPTLHLKLGQDEVMVPRPAQPNHHKHKEVKEDKKDSVYEKITQLLAAETKAHDLKQNHASHTRRINKRFVSGDSDLVAELRGLKHRIAT